MEIQALIEQARLGRFGAVHVLVGEEKFLIERAVGLLRAACLGDGPAGFNDDVFHGAKALGAQRILSAARTLPMMAEARFVLVRGVEALAPKELESLGSYLERPSPSTCLVLLAGKLDGRGRFVRLAKKKKVFTEARSLRGAAVRAFVESEARARGHELAPRASEALMDAIGSDLGTIDDALERLSLYVGADAAIEVSAVEACVTRVRTESIWALVDGVSLRDRARVSQAAGSLLADREPPLRILAMVARQLRTVAKMREALAAGLSGPEAAQRAGAPPFKARDLTQAARRFTMPGLREAFRTLAETDLALKGSKRPAPLVLEEALLRLCSPELHMRVSAPTFRRH